MEQPSGGRELDRLTTASIFVGVLSALFLVPFGAFVATPLLHPNAPYARLSQGSWVLGIGVPVLAALLILASLVGLAIKRRWMMVGGVLLFAILWSALAMPYVRLMSTRARCGAQMLTDSVGLRAIEEQLNQRVHDGHPLPNSVVPYVLQDDTFQKRMFTNLCSSLYAHEVAIGRFTMADVMRGRVSDAELKAELVSLASLRTESWEKLGPIYVCLDERMYRAPNANVITAFGVFEYAGGSRYVHVVHGDGHVETVSARSDSESQEMFFRRLVAQEAREDLAKPPVGWRDVLKEFLPGEDGDS